MTTDPTLSSVIYRLRMTRVLTAYDCGQLGPDTVRLVRSRSLTVGMPIGDHRALAAAASCAFGQLHGPTPPCQGWRGAAFVIGHHIAVAVLAANTCAVAIITFALYRGVI